jgi:5-hydroxyisourate hydrolase-like protein (transthyretin family)
VILPLFPQNKQQHKEVLMKKLMMLLVAASMIFAGFAYYGKVTDNDENTRVVRGQIVVDGKGIPGAVVQVFYRGQNLETQKPIFEVSCDATGKFIAEVGSDEYRLVPQAEGYQAKDALVLLSEAPSEISEQVLEVFPTINLFGETIFDGAPLTEVEIIVRPTYHSQSIRNSAVRGVMIESIFRRITVSDKKGAFQLLMPKGKAEYEIEGWKDGYTLSKSVTARSDQSPVILPFELKKEKGEYFQGIIRTPEGQPLAGAKIYAAPSNAEATSGPDGKFRLGPVEEEYFYPHFCVAWKDGYAPNHVELDFKQSDKLIELEVKRAFSIQGSLVDTKGKPIPNGNIRLRRGPNIVITDNSSRVRTLLGHISPRGYGAFEWLKSDDEGRFRFDHLPQGEYLLTYEPDGYWINYVSKPAALVKAQAGAEGVILQAGEFHGSVVTIRGRVTDRVSGEPLKGVKVDIGQVDQEGSGVTTHRVEKVLSNENGYFESKNLIEATSYSLACDPEGYAKTASEAVEYLAGEYEVNFSLLEERRVDVEVVDVRGKAAAGVEIAVNNQGGESLTIWTGDTGRTPVSADSNGKLFIYGMPAETITLMISRDFGAGLTKVEHDLRPAGPHQIRIQLPQALPEETQLLTINFINEKGAPERNISTDSDKALWVRAFDADNCLVDSKLAWREGNHWKRKWFNRAVGESAGSVSLLLPKSGGRIEVDADGFESRSHIISAANGENPKQRLNVVLVPN